MESVKLKIETRAGRETVTPLAKASRVAVQYREKVKKVYPG